MYVADTIVAPATPAGESALAVVRVSGPLALDLASACKGGSAPLPRHAWHADYCSLAGLTIDDAVFCFFQAPRSYTGEDSLEISCHGNQFIVSKIVGDLVARGCRLAEPGEFTKRAFLNGRLDLTQAEAVMDLIRARTDRALGAARRQLQGALRQRVDQAVNRLLDLCAAVEAHVDFPEEDLPAADRESWRTATVELAAELRGLAATRREGDLLRDGVKVVLLGAPNAGKSSLLNRLVGFERAIVSEDPGTTRDFLEERMVLGSWCVRLFDTAGLRDPLGAVERAGVQRTLACAREADVLLLVADAGQPVPIFPAEVAARLEGANVVVAVNKCDLPDRKFQGLGKMAGACVEVSALSGQGLAELREKLLSSIERAAGEAGLEEGVVVNARHESSLRDAVACLDRAADLMRTPAIDLVAVDVRAAIDALGRIVGGIDHEEVLDRLFARFCIGK